MSSSFATVSLPGLLTIGTVTAGRAAHLDALKHDAGVGLPDGSADASAFWLQGKRA